MNPFGLPSSRPARQRVEASGGGLGLGLSAIAENLGQAWTVNDGRALLAADGVTNGVTASFSSTLRRPATIRLSTVMFFVPCAVRWKNLDRKSCGSILSRTRTLTHVVKNASLLCLRNGDTDDFAFPPVAPPLGSIKQQTWP